MRIHLDTNIVLRNAVQGDAQHALVRDALDRLLDAGWELCIGTQNVIEFWVVATRPQQVNGLGMSPQQAAIEVAVLQRTFTVLRDPPDLLERWLDLCTRYDVSGKQAHDARIVALLLARGVTHRLTLNPADFRRYAEITCLTPDEV